MEILTDIALRAHWFRSHEKAYHVSKDTMLTPAARDFIREHGITLIYEDSALEGQPEVEVSSVPESVKAVNQLPDAAESVGEPCIRPCPWRLFRREPTTNRSMSMERQEKFSA